MEDEGSVGEKTFAHLRRHAVAFGVRGLDADLLAADVIERAWEQGRTDYLGGGFRLIRRRASNWRRGERRRQAAERCGACARPACVGACEREGADALPDLERALAETESHCTARDLGAFAIRVREGDSLRRLAARLGCSHPTLSRATTRTERTLQAALARVGLTEADLRGRPLLLGCLTTRIEAWASLLPGM